MHHVTLKKLFDREKPLPNDLITVPCCRKCNQEFARFEEEFRFILAGVDGADSHPVAKKLLKSKIWKRSASEKRAIVSTLQRKEVFSPHGLYLGKALGFDVSNPRFDKMVKMVVQGLLYHETKRLLSEEHEINWQVGHDPLTFHHVEIDQQMRDSYRDIGAGVFRYQRFVWPKRATSIWKFSFYCGPIFLATISTPHSYDEVYDVVHREEARARTEKISSHKRKWDRSRKRGRKSKSSKISEAKATNGTPNDPH